MSYVDPDPIFELEAAVVCVVCPGCAFTFDAVHEDDDGSRNYTCPVCGTKGRRE